MPCPLHREPMEHDLKCWPPFFRDVKSGVKTFELRKGDRDYMATDTLVLREWDPSTKAYTGDSCRVRVEYLLGGAWPGLELGYVVMAVKVL